MASHFGLCVHLRFSTVYAVSTHCLFGCEITYYGSYAIIFLRVEKYFLIPLLQITTEKWEEWDDFIISDPLYSLKLTAIVRICVCNHWLSSELWLWGNYYSQRSNDSSKLILTILKKTHSVQPCLYCFMFMQNKMVYFSYFLII